MQIKLTETQNSISPDLQARLRLVGNKKFIHEAMGLAVLSITKRAFNDAGLRPSVWANKVNGQPATLRKSGTLAKSVRMISATDSSVIVGSDRKYAAIHQLGGKTAAHVIRGRKVPGIGFRMKVNHPGSKIPARPYFPFSPDGRPTPVAHDAILQVLEKRLRP